MILVSMERRDPTLIVPNNCTLALSILNSQGVGNHLPSGRRVTEKAQEDEGL